MPDHKRSSEEIIRFLQEREKELGCLYRIEEVVNKPDVTPQEICKTVAEAIPPAWQYPEVCVTRVSLENLECCSPGFTETIWKQQVDIQAQDEVIGKIVVCYTQQMPVADDGPFLKEEIKLLNTIADRIGHFVMFRRIRQVAHDYQTASERLSEHVVPEWRVVVDLLRATDKNLFTTICRRMLNYLSWSGVPEAEELLQKSGSLSMDKERTVFGEDNRPLQRNAMRSVESVTDKVLDIAAEHLPEEQILANVQKWIQEDKLTFLIHVVNSNCSLAELTDALRRYSHIVPEDTDLPPAARKGILIALIRRTLSEQLQYINIAKKYFSISDFHSLFSRVIYTGESHGKLGGKSAGLLLAEQVVEQAGKTIPDLKGIRVPASWYVASDVLLSFLRFNNLTEVVEQKYKDINQVRLEYPHVVQSFKNCSFPPEILQGLSVVLDEFEGRPLIVRSSSLLEDRMGAAFSGKYRSLFITNRGSKQERMEELTDAIAEVYASTFGPDPIEYRAERGLLDFAEEMGIIIQEVVGKRVGDYFFPAFAGVAFSRNEFRWSPRIKREDGLVRLVPGLGTRAVDRIADDYPILIAPGQPALRVNVTPDEVLRYSPKHMDVLNLKTNRFETIDVHALLKQHGFKVPLVKQMVSVLDGDQIRKPIGVHLDFKNAAMIVNFEGLIADSDFVKQVRHLITVLEKELETPVDIEFAHDGENFHLLQCRPQSSSELSAPSPIPKDIPENETIFTANRYISNGRIPEITHVVYVDPEGYGSLPDRTAMLAVGRAVGKLNKILPKRRFVLMGPGRWGSRGDIRLGVSVTYSDINNCALLVEIARRKADYTPDLSFGTHFFQDLVEAGIRYLPLYPDDPDTLFNERFLKSSINLLPALLPEFASLADTVRVMDVTQATEDRVLRVLMNADLSEAIGFLTEPSKKIAASGQVSPGTERPVDDYWVWRLKTAEHIASQLDPDRFGVKSIYVFGSTKNATAGPASDIDLLVHFRGSQEQRRDLEIWLEGWSLSLAETNYLRTGYRADGLLDVHIITDEDIANKTSYAAKIDAVTDPARPLPMKHE
jgi:pyruvate,water dikinase